MATQTPNFNLNKPTVGGDNSVWGDLLNPNFDTIDTQMQSSKELSEGAVVRAGDTMTGPLHINTAGNGPLNFKREGTQSVRFSRGDDTVMSEIEADVLNNAISLIAFDTAGLNGSTVRITEDGDITASGSRFLAYTSLDDDSIITKVRGDAHYLPIALTPLADAFDLDSITLTAGEQEVFRGVGTLVNNPPTASGTNDVVIHYQSDGSTALQVYYSLTGSEPTMWLRSFAGAVWGAWSGLANTKYVDDSVPLYQTRAWVTFDSDVGGATVRGSGNVASVVRQSLGKYRITFTDPMTTTNYAVNMTASRPITHNLPAGCAENDTSPKTVNYVDVVTTNNAGAYVDCILASVTVVE